MEQVVSVVTPYYKESEDLLWQCHESVIRQKGDFTINHFMVADGYPQAQVSKWNCITMPGIRPEALDLSSQKKSIQIS